MNALKQSALRSASGEAVLFPRLIWELHCNLVPRKSLTQHVSIRSVQRTHRAKTTLWPHPHFYGYFA